MKNIELKVFIDNHSEIIRKLKTTKAKHAGILKQKDIYYNCNNGRLKSREINGKKFEVIFYKRPDLKESKVSDFQVIELNKDAFNKVNFLLEEVYGSKVVIKKKRTLWMYKNTRIHLDKVDKLGDFLELETQVKNNDLKKAKKEYNELVRLLNLSQYKTYKKSYSDMLK